MRLRNTRTAACPAPALVQARVARHAHFVRAVVVFGRVRVARVVEAVAAAVLAVPDAARLLVLGAAKEGLRLLLLLVRARHLVGITIILASDGTTCSTLSGLTTSTCTGKACSTEEEEVLSLGGDAAVRRRCGRRRCGGGEGLLSAQPRHRGRRGGRARLGDCCAAPHESTRPRAADLLRSQRNLFAARASRC